MNLLLFVLVNILMLTASYLVAYYYERQNSWVELWISTFLLYTSQITVTILFLGVVVRNLDTVPIVLVNGSISLLLMVLLRKHLASARTHFWLRCRSSAGEWVKSRDYVLFVLLFLFFMQVFFLLVKIYYFPPDVWDVFAYHLHPVVEWFQQNIIPNTIHTPVTRLNRNPMGPKLLHFWFVQLTGDMTWIELPQFFYGLITLLVSYVLMVKLKVDKFMALRYGLLIYFIPAIIIESRTAQDHLALTGVTLMTILYFVKVIHEKNPGFLLFLGLSMGLLLGTKISGPQIIAVLFLGLLCSLGFNFSKVREHLSGYWQQWVWCGMATGITGGYWYFKDHRILRSYFNVIKEWPWQKLSAVAFFLLLVGLLIYGWALKYHSVQENPSQRVAKPAVLKNLFRNKKVIYVAVVLLCLVLVLGVIRHAGLIKIFLLGHQNPAPAISDPALRSQYPILKLAHSRFAKNLLVFPFRIKDIGMYIEYTPDFLDQSGFGLQFFAFGLLAYCLMGLLFLTRKQYRTSIGGFLFIFSMCLLATYFLYYYSVANYRLFMFFPVIGIVLWAYITSTLPFKRYQLKILDLLILGMILFSITVTFFEGHREGFRWKNMFTMTETAARTSIQFSSFFTGDDWNYIDLYIAPAEPIGYLGHFDSWVFPYFDTTMQRRIFFLSSLQGFTLVPVNERRSQLILTPLFKENLKQRRIHYIHINPQGVRNRAELKKKKSIFIEDPDVCRVTDNLYYYKWE